MSQIPSNFSLDLSIIESHKPTPSQISNNSSLNILNKISAISMKTHLNSKNSSLPDRDEKMQKVLKDEAIEEVDDNQINLLTEKNEKKHKGQENRMITEKNANILKNGEKFVTTERHENHVPFSATTHVSPNILNKNRDYIEEGGSLISQKGEGRRRDTIDKSVVLERSFLKDRSLLNQSIRSSQNMDFLLENWKEYFEEDSPACSGVEEDYRLLIIRTLFHFFSTSAPPSLLHWTHDKKYGVLDCTFNYMEFWGFLNENKGNQELFEMLIEILSYLESNPVELLNSFNLVLDAYRTRVLKKNRRKICVRMINLPNLTKINEVKSDIIMKFISIKGIILKTGSIKLLCTSLSFFCPECKKSFKKRFPDGLYIPPSSCESSMKCKNKFFQIDKNKNECILYQRIRVEEEGEDGVGGRMPSTIDCELREGLVGRVKSGETVIVNGVVKTENFEENKGKNQQGLYNIYLDVNSLTKWKDNDPSSTTLDDDRLSEQDMQVLETLSNLAKRNQLLPLLIKSFCPSIYGHELIKAGLILGMLGGSSKVLKNDVNGPDNENKKSQSFRSNCHVLLIGDPGLGKSQLLRFVSNVAPRSVYVCGKSSSTVGLTVSVQRDGCNGEGSMEAGALVLSDKGVCCIDEFDKMEKEHLALLESMEQQTVSIAKSGVLCSLRTRTSIFASANPAGGNYNKQKNIKENIKISNAILSRFDLIFLMLDVSDPQRDQKLSEHVMKLHNFRKRTRQQFENKSKDGFSYSQFQNNYSDYNFQKQGRMNDTKNMNFNEIIEEENEIFQGNKYISLAENLAKKCERIVSILQPQIIRKYLTYIKKNFHPRLTSEASEVLKNFYLKLRENSETFSTLPITTRQLESLIRLSQARARLDFRNEVTKQDAIEIVELMQESLFDALEDISYNQSKLPLKSQKNSKIFNVGALSVPKQTKIFIEKLNEESLNKNSDVFDYQELLKIAKGLNLSLGLDFSSYVEKLNFENYLILKGGRNYQLTKKKEF